MAEDASISTAPWSGEHPLEHISDREKVKEVRKCQRSPAYFLRRFVFIEVVEEEGQGGSWVPFLLWPAQEGMVGTWLATRLLLVPKARQLGVTWLFLGLMLWKMLFRPGSKVGIWSRRETEAIHLLNHRIKGIYRKLPSWMQCREAPVNNAKEWVLSNGSSAMAFPTSAGDSYTFTDALIDEADLAEDLGRLLDAVKPTIDGGGSMAMVSKLDKARPHSPMKRLCRKATEEPERSPWRVAFLPWTARPGRDAQWYEAQRQHSLDTDGTLDYLHGNYPATLEEALAPTSANKRLPASHLLPVYEPSTPLPDLALGRGAPGLDGLRVYALPVPGREYRVGADPAEGLAGPDHDDSALVVVDKDTGEEVATLHGRLEPKHALPEAIEALCRWYNDAPVLVERNNHGHTVLLALEARDVVVLCGPDGRPGYAKSPASKALVWSSFWGEVVARCRDRLRALAEGTPAPPPLVRDFTTYTQLASLEASTCKAPSGERDDVADARGIAHMARTLESGWEDWTW